MGTIFNFQIEDRLSDAELARYCEGAMDILRDADETFSLYKTQSEISELNSGVRSWSSASSVQKKIREDSLSWKDQTAGFFDPISPEGRYDPSGLVKTWAARNACHFLEGNGVRQFTLNVGGDIFLSADLASPKLNRVGLSNLRSIAATGAGSNLVLDLAGTGSRAVATSGVSERGEHIWSPAKGPRYLQATVAAEDLVLADIWATALVSGGDAAFGEFERRVDKDTARALVTTRDLAIRSSAGFAELLATI